MAEIGDTVIACRQKMVVEMWVFHGSPLQSDVAEIAKWQYGAMQNKSQSPAVSADAKCKSISFLSNFFLFSATHPFFRGVFYLILL